MGRGRRTRVAAVYTQRGRARAQKSLLRLGTQLVEIQSGEPQAQRIEPIRNSLHLSIPGHGIPRGGFWTSTVDAAGNSAWVSGQGNRNHYLLFPQPARVYVLDSFEDGEVLAEQYVAQTRADTLTALDWPAIATDYDAVHLSERGVADCYRVGAQEPENELAASFESWDCESTLWFRWCFEGFERVPNQ